jgi:hypothetical protein
MHIYKINCSKYYEFILIGFFFFGFFSVKHNQEFPAIVFLNLYINVVEKNNSTFFSYINILYVGGRKGCS